MVSQKWPDISWNSLYLSFYEKKPVPATIYGISLVAFQFSLTQKVPLLSDVQCKFDIAENTCVQRKLGLHKSNLS